MNPLPDSPHEEKHLINRIGWLRAAVLGANDGIVSVSSLMVGVAAAESDHWNVMIAGVAGMVAGAMSMAAGEYISVSSQADMEHSEINRERRELESAPEWELEELTQIYQQRGLSRNLAEQVASELTTHNALEAHTRDELGINEITTAQPVLAAISSATAFALGSALPIVTALLTPLNSVVVIVSSTSLLFLALLGGVSAYVGGSNIGKAVIRVTFWGALAMIATALIGRLFGVSV